MKNIFYAMSFIPLIFTSFSACENSSASIPQLTFKYDWRGKCFDKVSSWLGHDIPLEKLEKQFNTVLPRLINAWEHDAPLLFGEITTHFNRGLTQKKRTALISLTTRWSYGSHRFLVLGLRPIFDYDWPSFIKWEDWFTSQIFHELLHVWVDEHINKESSILKKYQQEDSQVLDHIHLMALQKMVYLNLNRHDMLEMLDGAYRKYSLPSYKRAWEIVKDIEGYEIILEDIKQNLKPIVT